MDFEETIVELSKSLVTCRYKADRGFLRGLIGKVYNRATKDETPSRIADMEQKLSQLSIKAGFTSGR